MANLNQLFNLREHVFVDIPDPFRPRGGLQHFHLFPKLLAEIRLIIWKLSFPSACAIRVRPLIDKDRPLSYCENTSREVLDIRFFYADNDPIMAL